MKSTNDINNLLDGYSQEQPQQQQSITGMLSSWSKRGQTIAQSFGKKENLKPAGGERKRPSIFGIPLSQALEKSNRAMGKQERIPRIALRCIEYLDARGCDELGIYRLSGSTKDVQALRAQFDQYQDVDLMQDFRDPNAVASLFKAYVRELPDCLLTNALLNDFTRLFDRFSENDSFFQDYVTPQDNHPIIQDRQLLTDLRQMILRLPQENIDFLALFLRHLRRIAKNHNNNKMGLNNLQVVWSPTLNFGGALFLTLLVHVDTLFPDLPVNSSAAPPLRISKPTTSRSGNSVLFNQDLTDKQLPLSPRRKSASLSDMNNLYSNGFQNRTSKQSQEPKSLDKSPLSSKPSNGNIPPQPYPSAKDQPPTVPQRKSSAQREISVYSASRYDSQPVMPELPPRKAELDFYSKPLSLPKTLNLDPEPVKPPPKSALKKKSDDPYRPISVDDYLDLFESPTSPSENHPKPLPVAPVVSKLDFVGLPPVSIDHSPLIDFNSLDVKFEKFLSSDEDNEIVR